MSNTSIKIECFHVPINKSNPKEILGYLLLKVKGAQTIDPTSNDRVSNNNFIFPYIGICYSIIYCPLNTNSFKINFLILDRK